MTFELTTRRRITLIDAPSLIIILATLSILAEDLFKRSLPYLIRAEVKALVQYDITSRDLRRCAPLLSVGAAFTVFYICFLVIEIWS